MTLYLLCQLNYYAMLRHILCVIIARPIFTSSPTCMPSKYMIVKQLMNGCVCRPNLLGVALIMAAFMTMFSTFCSVKGPRKNMSFQRNCGFELPHAKSCTMHTTVTTKFIFRYSTEKDRIWSRYGVATFLLDWERGSMLIWSFIFDFLFKVSLLFCKNESWSKWLIDDNLDLFGILSEEKIVKTYALATVFMENVLAAGKE